MPFIPPFSSAPSAGSTPGGADTQVQFNDGGAFGGDAGLTFNKTTDAVTIAGNISITGIAGQTNVINESGADQDTRIEGDTDPNTFYLDAGNNRVGVGTDAPAEKIHVIGNFRIADAVIASETKGYRFRTSGGNLDLDFSGADGFISVFSAANYGGTQRDKLRLVAGANEVKAVDIWQFTDGPFGATHHLIDGEANGDAVFNEDGQADADFRVEGDTVTTVIHVDASDDTVIFGGGQSVKRTAVSDTNYTVLLTDYVIGYSSLTASRTVTLPTVATAGSGRVYVVKDEAGTAAANNIVIDGNGAETVDGAASTTINTNYGSKTVYCSGSAWFII